MQVTNQISLEKVDEIVDSYDAEKESLIQVLQDITSEYNYLPEPCLRQISQRLNVPLSEVFEVTTFYKAFSLEPRGKMILELLLAKCPDVEIIKTLAKSYDIDKPRFKLENQTCIMCGLCVRVCKEVIGASAISLVGRGVDTKIDTPFHLSSEVCTGCGACAAVCPTGMIQLRYAKDEVEIQPFNTIVKLRQCISCGNGLASEAFMSSVSKKLGGLSKLALLCNDCKKERESLALANSTRYSKRIYDQKPFHRGKAKA